MWPGHHNHSTTTVNKIKWDIMVQHFNSLNTQLLHYQEKKKQKEKKNVPYQTKGGNTCFFSGFIILHIFLGSNVHDTILCTILCHNLPCGESWVMKVCSHMAYHHTSTTHNLPHGKLCPEHYSFLGPMLSLKKFSWGGSDAAFLDGLS